TRSLACPTPPPSKPPPSPISPPASSSEKPAPLPPPPAKSSPASIPLRRASNAFTLARRRVAPRPRASLREQRDRFSSSIGYKSVLELHKALTLTSPFAPA